MRAGPGRGGRGVRRWSAGTGRPAGPDRGHPARAAHRVRATSPDLLARGVTLGGAATATGIAAACCSRTGVTRQRAPAVSAENAARNGRDGCVVSYWHRLERRDISIFNQLVLRPLPVAEPQRLVNLAAPGPKPGSEMCNGAGACDDVSCCAEGMPAASQCTHSGCGGGGMWPERAHLRGDGRSLCDGGYDFAGSGGLRPRCGGVMAIGRSFRRLGVGTTGLMCGCRFCSGRYSARSRRGNELAVAEDLCPIRRLLDASQVLT